MQRFELNVKYKLNKRNIISNILLKLININIENSKSNYIKLDIFFIKYIYIITFIEINEDFKKRVINNYREN